MKHKKIVRRTVYHILVCLGAFVRFIRCCGCS